MELSELDRINIRISNLESRIALLEIMVFEKEKESKHEDWCIVPIEPKNNNRNG